ncbi:MAG: hypothetical protein ACHQT7_01145 [Candidatus Levyibacteriota bacterium]
MNLPFLSKKQEDKEFFLALLLSPGEVRSILFEKNTSGLLILGTCVQEFSEHLNTLTAEKLVELSDVVISEVEQKLPEGESFEKVIFSVPHSWVLEGKIVKEHLAKLKNLCEALKLSPIGFIVSIEAVIAYLHKKEGLPVTAVFVEVSQKHVTLSLVKNGTVLNVFEHEIEKDTIATVEKLLASQEDMEVLPSKIILLNYEHAKKIQQSFLSHTWAKNIQFLHLPQVEVLDTEVEAQAVISGVATQMGFNTLPEMNISAIASQESPVEVALDEKDEERVEEKEGEREEKDVAEFAGEKAGFFKDVDVLKQEAVDIPEEISSHENLKPIDEIEEEKQERDLLSSSPRFSKPSLPGISFGFIPKFSRSMMLHGKFALIYPILAVLFFILLIVSYYYFFEKAQVVLVLDKKNVNKELAVSFSSTQATSGQDSIVHVDTVSVQESGKDTTNTTGKKETGDKAKGAVTIYNKTDSPKTFAKGTAITGPNNLMFDLTGDAQVASTSSFATSFSSTDTNVVAEQFGKEYNLPSASNFQIQGIATSDFFAKNNSAFSGGTKKEITAVSATDISSLQTKVVNTLSQKAAADAGAKKSADAEILSLPLDFSFDQKTFSKKEGDEASSLSLSATITFTLGSYKKSDLVTLAKDATQKDAPSDYSYSGKDSEISIKDTSQDKSGNVSGKLVFSSVFLPQISSASFSGEIAGKSTDKASQLIQVKGVTTSQIQFVRSLPFFPKILPFNKNNIEIVTKTQ